MIPDAPDIAFFVAGRPRSTQTGSVIRAGKRLIPIRRGTAWSAVVGLVARQHAPRRPFEGPLRVSLTFTMPSPVRPTRSYPSRPDLGNSSKGLLDAMSGVLWVDDSQVIALSEEKRYGPAPGVYVQVWRETGR